MPFWFWRWRSGFGDCVWFWRCGLRFGSLRFILEIGLALTGHHMNTSKMKILPLASSAAAIFTNFFSFFHKTKPTKWLQRAQTIEISMEWSRRQTYDRRMRFADPCVNGCGSAAIFTIQRHSSYGCGICGPVRVLSLGLHSTSLSGNDNLQVLQLLQTLFGPW